MGQSTSVRARLGTFLVVLALAAGGGWGAGRLLNPSGVVLTGGTHGHPLLP